MKKSLLVSYSCVFLFLFSTTSHALADDPKKSKPNNNQTLLTLPFDAAEKLIVATFDLGGIFVGSKRLASPFGEFVSDSVSSTSVVTRKDIERSGSRNVPEALNEIPGVALTDLVGNGEEPTVDFRGFNEGGDVVYLLEGVRLNEPKSNNMNFPLIPTSLIERIEISRGSSSFLYGEGAVGGTVNFAGRAPKKDGFFGEATSLVGSFGQWGESLETGFRKENVSLYLTGDVYHTRGFRQNTSVEKESFYTKGSWEVSDKIGLGLTYLHGRAHLDRSGSIRETYLRLYGPEATERPRNFSDLQSDLGILDFRLLPLEEVALTGNVFLRDTAELSVANFATFERADNELDLSTSSWGTTFQAEHSKEIPWKLKEDFLIGMDYTHHDIDEEDFNRSKSTLQRLARTVDSDSTKDATGIFSKLAVSWNERAGAYYGARYDWIGFRNNDRINLQNNEPTDISKLSQSAGASYQIFEPLAASVTYSHSFKAPALSDLYANPLFGGNPALRPEESSDYEAGLRWKQGGVMLKNTWFLIRRTNEIGFDPGLTDAEHLFGRNNNFGKTERVGVENFAEWKPVSSARLRISHTYTEAVFKSNLTPDPFATDPFENQISGDHIPMVPRNRFTADIWVEPVKNLELDLGMVSVAKQVLTNDLNNDRNGRRLPAYLVFNFRTFYTCGQWRFSFEVDNLLDERYESGGSLGLAPSSFNSDHTVEDNFFVPAPGRSYAVTVSYSW